MEKQDLLEELSGSTPWIVPLVSIPKANGELRLCLKMMGQNTAVQRTRHNTPALDDLVHDLNGASIFSKLDINNASHQIELHPESRYLTIFSSPVGLRRFKRLVFWCKLCLRNISKHTRSSLARKGVRNIRDDILVHDSD